MVNYPINSIVDKKLIDNPYVTLSGSNFVEVKFNPSDSSHFLGNVGKKVNLELQDLQQEQDLDYTNNI